MENSTMKIELTGDALTLFEDFLKYGTINMDEVADAMYYDKNGFDKRLFLLQKAYVKARDNAHAEARREADSKNSRTSFTLIPKANPNFDIKRINNETQIKPVK